MNCTHTIHVILGLSCGNISYGVGSGVVCSTGLGNARASDRGTDNETVHAFFVSITKFCLEQSKVTDMKIADNASIDDITHGGGEIPPCTGLTPDALPEVQEPVLTENSQTGIPTRKALSGSTLKTIKGKPKEVLGDGLQR